MIRRFFAALLITSSLASFTLDARWCSPCGEFEVGGELLFMRTSSCDMFYAIIDPRPFSELLEINPDSPEDVFENLFPQGSKKSVRPDYHPGFRVWGGYVLGNSCLDIEAIYTRIHNTDKGSAHPSGEQGLWPTLYDPNANFTILYNPLGSISGQIPACARATFRFSYDAGDLQIGGRAMMNCRLWTRGFFGLHFANIERSCCVNYAGTEYPGLTNQQQPTATAYTLLSRRSATLWGIGPEIGVQGIYTVACGFGIGGQFTTGLIAGSNREKFSMYQTTTSLVPEPSADAPIVCCLDSGSRTQLSPFVDARLGVNYITGLCNNLVVVGEFGYEFRTYFEALKTQQFVTDAFGPERCESFNFDGFYLSLMIQI